MRLVLLGLPPSTNNLYAIVEGRQVTVLAGRAFKRATGAIATRAWPSGPSSRSCAVLVTYHLGSYDRDVDGSHKALLDGLSGVVWKDDRQIVLFCARKVRLARGVLPYISVVIRELSAAPAWRAPVARPGMISFSTTVMPPSTNNTYTVWRGVRRKSAQARQVYDVYRAGFERLVERHGALAGDIRVSLRQGFSADRRDVDGSHKLLFDAARKLLWADDRQIVGLTIAKARVARGDQPLLEGRAWACAARPADSAAPLEGGA